MEVTLSLNYVFNHINDLTKWWPEEYVGGIVELDTEFVFKTGKGHFSKNKVIEFEPDTKIAWLTTESFREGDDYDWRGTKFIFELTSKDENTVVKFTYDGVALENEVERLAKICEKTLKKC